MVGFVPAVGSAVRATACAVLSANEFVNGAVGLVSPASRDFFNGYVNATRRLIGCTAPDIEPPPPAFTGGQCDALYRGIGTISYERVFCGTGQVINIDDEVWATEFQLQGPISGVAGRVVQDGDCGARIWGLFVQTATGEQLLTQVLGVAGNRDNRNFSFTANFERAGGVPDDCGDSAPVYPPPIDIDIDIDITYEDDEGTTINVTIPFVFSPITVDFDGSLSIPFNFDFGGFTFDGSLNLDPDLTVNINLPKLPRGTGQGVDTVAPGDPENEVDPAPGDQKIIGVVVTSTVNAQSNLTNIATQGMPPIVAPRLGSIKFAYSLGVSTFWSNDIDIKGQRVFIPCPFSQGADAAVASPVPGVSLSFVEVRGYPLATTRDLG